MCSCASASPWLFQRFGHRLVQQAPPRAADVAVHHLAQLVVAEVVDAAFGLLAQQAPPDQRLHRVQQLRLALAADLQQRVEIEMPAQHRGRLQHRTQGLRHMGQAHAHRGAQASGSAPGRGGVPAAGAPSFSDCSIDTRKNGLPSVSRCRRSASAGIGQ